jgi:hypothetical protein
MSNKDSDEYKDTQEYLNTMKDDFAKYEGSLAEVAEQ